MELLLTQEEIFGLEPRSPREPRPDSTQQLDQKRDHRPLHYHTTTRPSSRTRFSGGTTVQSTWCDESERPHRHGVASCANGAFGIAAIDMFVAVSASFRLLYVMVILAHGRRKIVRFDNN